MALTLTTDLALTPALSLGLSLTHTPILTLTPTLCLTPTLVLTPTLARPQVYRAVLRETGEVVAVKVQRPGVQSLVSKDLYVLRRAAEVYQG